MPMPDALASQVGERPDDGVLARHQLRSSGYTMNNARSLGCGLPLKGPSPVGTRTACRSAQCQSSSPPSTPLDVGTRALRRLHRAARLCTCGDVGHAGRSRRRAGSTRPSPGSADGDGARRTRGVVSASACHGEHRTRSGRGACKRTTAPHCAPFLEPLRSRDYRARRPRERSRSRSPAPAGACRRACANSSSCDDELALATAARSTRVTLARSASASNGRARPVEIVVTRARGRAAFPRRAPRPAQRSTIHCSTRMFSPKPGQTNLPSRVLAEPVDAEDPRRMRDRLAHRRASARSSRPRGSRRTAASRTGRGAPRRPCRPRPRSSPSPSSPPCRRPPPRCAPRRPAARCPSGARRTRTRRSARPPDRPTAGSSDGHCVAGDREARVRMRRLAPPCHPRASSPGPASR